MKRLILSGAALLSLTACAAQPDTSNTYTPATTDAPALTQRDFENEYVRQVWDQFPEYVSIWDRTTLIDTAYAACDYLYAGGTWDGLSQQLIDVGNSNGLTESQMYDMATAIGTGLGWLCPDAGND